MMMTRMELPVVRIEGEGDIMRFLNGASMSMQEGELRNYDVGITACAPGGYRKDRNSDFSFRLAMTRPRLFR